MKNRNLSSPILSVLVLLLIANSSLRTRAEPVGPNSSNSNPSPSSTTAGFATTAPARDNASTYTVVKGDSLTSIAEKFNTTRKNLKKLNDLTTSIVKPGQILQVPTTRSAKSKAIALRSQAKGHDTVYVRAQPVQDFDIPASTFASCPVAVPDEDSDAPVVAPEQTSPVAKLVSPAELEADSAQESATMTKSAPVVTEPIAPSGFAAYHSPRVVPAFSTSAASSSPTFVAPAPRFTNRRSNLGSSPASLTMTSSNDWANRFLAQARALGNEGIEYDDDWRPPGESRAWTMDCSNTSRYLYKVTTGIQLPRTASDQYYYLHLQGKAWDVPQNANGYADTDYLRENLKPGDLLFWENTYRPERQPPITHVMVFLGTNDRGQWIMAGSQTSRGGEHNRRNGGPDIYVFRPSQPCGGYTTWLGLVHHQGRFCAFGRPLEADASKLAVAANE